MKKTAIAALSLGLALAAASIPAVASSAPTGESIVRSARERNAPSSMTARAKLIVADSKGNVSERMVDQATSRSGGVVKTVIVFQKPESLRNTRFLSIGSADKWIYLPEARKTRRIAASEGSSSFMGTDFTYDDLGSQDRDVSKDAHTLLGEGAVGGRAAWIVESKPSDASSSQYSKTVSYIDKESYAVRKIEMYDKKGKLLKTLEVNATHAVGGYELPVDSLMRNVQAGSSTRILIDKATLAVDKALPESLFTLSYLETGKY